MTAGLIVGVVAIPLAIAFARIDGITVILTEIQDQPRQAIQRGKLVEMVGAGHVVGSLDLAIAMSGQIASGKPKAGQTPAG